ncbi:MAG: LacI family DNA-binding transcriptional regulator [Actinomycetia bacterium]|nr:LacI family DNA-binding transcriptional regulator [Actinomycetes bacterium]
MYPQSFNFIIIKEIARLANVLKSTVSIAINNNMILAYKIYQVNFSPTIFSASL